MSSNLDLISFALALFCKAAALAARWAGMHRRWALKSLANMSIDEKDREIIFLREENAKLKEHLEFFQNQVRKGPGKRHYNIKERLFVIFQMEYLKLPRYRVKEYFGVARSTFYRWLHKVDDAPAHSNPPANKTPDDIIDLVWNIAKSNPAFGKVKIAGQLAILKVFLAASTVRNILNRPKPHFENTVAFIPENDIISDFKSIPSFYPNHVWSVDFTVVYRYGFFKTYVFAAIDHFSRKAITVIPLEGPNAAWTIDALENAFFDFGPPKHIITDKEGIFRGKAFQDLLENWGVKHRFGKVGNHGSIAVTERIIKTLKYEWLKRVPFIRNFAHLEQVCAEFVEWYNSWRPHMKHGGLRPDDYYCRDIPEPVAKSAKTIPKNIERKMFKETRIIGFRLKDAA